MKLILMIYIDFFVVSLKLVKIIAWMMIHIMLTLYKRKLMSDNDDGSYEYDDGDNVGLGDDDEDNDHDHDYDVGGHSH